MPLVPPLQQGGENEVNAEAEGFPAEDGTGDADEDPEICKGKDMAEVFLADALDVRSKPKVPPGAFLAEPVT